MIAMLINQKYKSPHNMYRNMNSLTLHVCSICTSKLSCYNTKKRSMWFIAEVKVRNISLLFFNVKADFLVAIRSNMCSREMCNSI